MFPTSSNPWVMITLALVVWPLVVFGWVAIVGLTLLVCVFFPPAIPGVIAGLSRREVRHGV